MLDPRLMKRVAHRVFTAFAQDFGDLEYRSPFLQIQTLDLLDLSSCEARFLAHLLPSFALSLSGGAQAPSTLSAVECQPVGMIPLDPLLQRLAGIAGMESGCKRLVVVLGQLGDFDSIEYAQALVPRLPQLTAVGVKVQLFGIGNAASAERFAAFTSFPLQQLIADPSPLLHQSLGLEAGLKLPGGPWPGFLLMCAGVGSPGTLREVLRGYTGDRSAAQIFDDDEWVEAFPIPRFQGALFRRAGGAGFQRPFELATKRLRNMNEVLRNWSTYVPCDDYITQRGATVLLDGDDSVIYCHRDQSLLGYSATMERPLAFLDEVLAEG